jgi:hypothetical protein
MLGGLIDESIVAKLGHDAAHVGVAAGHRESVFLALLRLDVATRLELAITVLKRDGK